MLRLLALSPIVRSIASHARCIDFHRARQQLSSTFPLSRFPPQSPPTCNQVPLFRRCLPRRSRRSCCRTRKCRPLPAFQWKLSHRDAEAFSGNFASTRNHLRKRTPRSYFSAPSPKRLREKRASQIPLFRGALGEGAKRSTRGTCAPRKFIFCEAENFPPLP